MKATLHFWMDSFLKSNTRYEITYQYLHGELEDTNIWIVSCII